MAEEAVACSHDGEEEWLPNPYQALADAQVRAGAWSGMHLLGGSGVARTPVLAPIAPVVQVQTMIMLLDPQQQQQPSPLGGKMLEPLESGYTLQYSAPKPWTATVDGFNFAVRNSKHASWLGDADAASSPSESDRWKSKHGDSCDSVSTTTAEAPSHASDDEGTAESAQGWESPCASDRRQLGAPQHFGHADVPRKIDFAKLVHQEACTAKTRKKQDSKGITTLMIRNLPKACTRDKLVEELELLGFMGEYDFLYLPIDQSTQWNVGYAFANFLTSAGAARCKLAMQGHVFRCFPHGSGKITQVSDAHLQGLQKNLEYYSKTAVQCTGSEASRPLVLRGQEYYVAASSRLLRPMRKSLPRRRQRRR